MLSAALHRSGKRFGPRSAPASALPFVLREERARREWSQRQLSDYLGVSQSAVARWEAGTRFPPVAELERVGHLLDITFIVS